MNKKDDIKQIDPLVKENEELKAKYLRALADYQNLEKRVVIQRSEDIKFAARNLITKLLPAIETLEKVIQTVKDQGLDLALKQIHEVLNTEQVEKIEVIGKKFDPFLMECVEVVESDKDDEVVEETRSGYKMHGQVIQVARVKVGKKKVEGKQSS